MRLDRRDWWRWLAAAGAGVALSGCANLFGREPVRVTLAGLDPLPSEGLEVRMAVKLRVQNPNETALDYSGISVQLDVRGASFASGVSNQHGRIERFEDGIITIPVSISALAVLRQAVGFARNQSPRIDYTLSGHLAGTGFGGVHFKSSGEVDLPVGLGSK